MKFATATAVLLLVLGSPASIHARQEKGQEEHKQEARPAQQQAKAKPAQQPERQATSSGNQHTQSAKPTNQQHAQHAQQATRAQQPQTHAASQTPQSRADRTQAGVQQTHAAGGNRGGSQHGRISDAHYASSFGSGHSFHVNRGDYDHRRFAYGGYSFGFVDPWPVGWGYSDDVYVVYSDGNYYMYDRVHPGVHISISIL